MTADELAEAFGPGLKETVVVLYNDSLFFLRRIEFIMTQPEIEEKIRQASDLIMQRNYQAYKDLENK